MFDVGIYDGYQEYCQEVKDLNKTKQILRNFHEHMNQENKTKFTKYIVKKMK